MNGHGVAEGGKPIYECSVNDQKSVWKSTVSNEFKTVLMRTFGDNAWADPDISYAHKLRQSLMHTTSLQCRPGMPLILVRPQVSWTNLRVVAGSEYFLPSSTCSLRSSASFNRPWFSYVQARLAILVSVSGWSMSSSLLLATITCSPSFSASFNRPWFQYVQTRSAILLSVSGWSTPSSLLLAS